MAGNHYNLFDIKALFDELCNLIQEAQTPLNGLFPNADSSFDARVLREACFRHDIEANIAHSPRSAPGAAIADRYFDAERYRQRTAIERTNTGLDRFKTLLMRYETNVQLACLPFSGLYRPATP